MLFNFVSRSDCFRMHTYFNIGFGCKCNVTQSNPEQSQARFYQSVELSRQMFPFADSLILFNRLRLVGVYLPVRRTKFKLADL